jgi:hypothetical protein
MLLPEADTPTVQQPREASLLDADRGIVDFDAGARGPGVKGDQRLPGHQRRRPPARRLAGADHDLRRVTLRRRRRDDVGHHLACVTGARTDAHAKGGELGGNLGGAGDEARALRRRRLHRWFEPAVEALDVALGRRPALQRGPAGRDGRVGQERAQMIELGPAHVAARLLGRERKPLFGKHLDQRLHGRHAAKVDHGAGPVEHHRFDRKTHARASTV